MSLYRKYRPQKFSEVIGQDHVVKTLKGALESGQVSHAYIFAGPRGTGKTSVARILAKSVNCLNFKDYEPCGQCNICKQIAEGSFLDLIEIDAASNRGIDEIRDLKEKIRFAPNQGKYKVYIIDEVHMLTKEAFNALLKTLEEPPAHAIFILATTEVHKIPLTILSRCQIFDFRKIKSDKILEDIKRVAEREKIKIDNESLKKIVVLSEGSIRDALSYLDQVHAFAGDRNIDLNLLGNILGISKEENLVAILDLIKKRDIKEIISLINRLVDEGVDLEVFLKDLICFTREVLLVKIDKKALSEELIETKAAEKIADDFSFKRLIKLIELLNELLHSLKFSFLPQLYLELAIIKMLGEDSLEINVNSLEEKTDIRNAMEENFVEKRMTGDDEDSLVEKDKDNPMRIETSKEGASEKFSNWENFLQKIKEENISIYMALQGADFSLQENKIKVIVHNQFYFDRLQDQKNYQILQNKIKYCFGQDKELDIVKGERKDEKEKDIISEALSVFGGEVIE